MNEKMLETPIEWRIFRYLLTRPGHVGTLYKLSREVAPDYPASTIWKVVNELGESGFISCFRDPTGQSRLLHLRLNDPTRADDPGDPGRAESNAEALETPESNAGDEND